MDVVALKFGGGEIVELFFLSIPLDGLIQTLRKFPGLLRSICKSDLNLFSHSFLNTYSQNVPDIVDYVQVVVITDDMIVESSVGKEFYSFSKFFKNK